MKTVFWLALGTLGLASVALLASCSHGVSGGASGGASASVQSAPPANAGAELSDADLAKMSRRELAQYIFKHNGCDSCHALSAQGRLGYTAHGLQVSRQAEGCVDLLTAVKAISEKPPAQWTAAEHTTYAHFGEFGCTACHEIRDGELRPTALGERLGNLHVSCPAVMHLLSEGGPEAAP
jgi:cytochrome c2